MMASGICTGSGVPIPVLIPSRYYALAVSEQIPQTQVLPQKPVRFSLSAMADFAAEAGFDGIDLSLDEIDIHDDGLMGVLYAFAQRTAARGLILPVCHLPFYMPAPDNARAMADFAREQMTALRAIAPLHIPLAVIHPIVRHSSVCTQDAWLAENLHYLAPLRELSERLGITLAIENMTGRPYARQENETVFGCRAEHIMALAERLDTGICWDFGHAHLSGISQTEALAVVGSRLRTVHIHDNDGQHDSHLIPGQGSIHWPSAMAALRATGYGAAASPMATCLDLELKTSHLPADRSLRQTHAARALLCARRLAEML